MCVDEQTYYDVTLHRYVEQTATVRVRARAADREDAKQAAIERSDDDSLVWTTVGDADLLAVEYDDIIEAPDP